MSAVDEDLTYIDEFCGAGGASVGLTAAGFRLKLGINHWDRAIETHSRNFPHADHWCEDTSKLDMRRLPHARILWASPICTEVSPAGGRRRRRKEVAGQAELELEGHVGKAAYVRTRATFYDVLRSTEVRRFDAVLIENVVDVASDWELFDWWVEAMKRLGYNVQFVSVSAAHVGAPDNPHAPQWRDRLYLVFTKLGIRLPDVEPRPLAWCETCGADTHAIQSWKRPGRKIGKYRQQYVYVCERATCRHAVVEPYVLPAAAAIDWSDLGERIGDKRSRRKDGLPLAPKTLARIEAGLAMFAQPITLEAAGNTFERPGSGYFRAWPAYAAPATTFTTDPTKALALGPVMLSVNHDDGGRPYPAHVDALPTRTVKLGDGLAVGPMLVPAGGTWRDHAETIWNPMGARTTSESDALVCPPFIAELRGGGSTARSVADPLATLTASGTHHGLTVPPGAFYTKHYGGNADPRGMSKDVRTTPLGTVTAVDHHSLVIPFRRCARPYPAGRAPLSAVLTESQHGLAQLGVDVMDCRFRMLQPRETLRAQRFPDQYEVVGNAGERYMQAGNAVAANVAQWLGAQLRAVLDQAVAA